MTSRRNTLLHTPTTGDAHETWEKRYPRGGGTKTSDPEPRGGDSDGQVIPGDGRRADLTHISLFTGIGGFDLAAEWAGFRTIAMCEIDPFCQEVLAARFGAVADTEGSGLEGTISTGSIRTGGCPSEHNDGPVLIPDIFSFDGTRFRGATLLTGGFPCQPFSHAGRREGTEDKKGRHLWPQMLRVIAESRPRYVIAENVPGLISIQDGVVFEQVCADLEREGYAVQAFIIPACGKNAPHRRDRVWIVGHTAGAGQQTQRASGIGQGARPIVGEDSDAPDAERDNERAGLREGGEGWERRGRPSDLWGTPWIEVATRFCGTPHGLSDWLHRSGRGLNAETTENLTGQDMPYLWAYLQQEEIYERLGGCEKIPVKENVFAVLWEFFIGATQQPELSTESAEAQEAMLRNVWHDHRPGCSPQRYEYQEQRARELEDALPLLSHEVAFQTRELVKKYSRQRVNRLKALGNAIVPAVAREICLAIRQAIEEEGEDHEKK